MIQENRKDQTSPRNKDKCRDDSTTEDVRTECSMKVIIIPNETQPRSLLTHATSSTSHIGVTNCEELVVIVSYVTSVKIDQRRGTMLIIIVFVKF